MKKALYVIGFLLVFCWVGSSFLIPVINPKLSSDVMIQQIVASLCWKGWLLVLPGYGIKKLGKS